MGSVITVRNIDAGDKSWLKREARQHDVSMEEFVRRLIREKREKAERCRKPSEAFRQFFGPEHGVDASSRTAWLSTGYVLRKEPAVIAPTAWLIDTNVLSEMMRPNPG